MNGYTSQIDMEQTDSRRGVALIVVLGLLGVLTMMGVAFGLTMRIERLAALHYEKNSRSDHLLYAALGRAMQYVDDQVGDSYLVPFIAGASDTGGGDVFSAILDGEGTNGIPQSAKIDALNAAGGVRWQPAPGGAGAEFAWTVVNLSGHLDVGHVDAAGGGVRNLGADPTEIELEQFSEVVGDGSLFITNRNTFGSFETLKSMYVLGGTNGALMGYPNDLVAYSLYRPDLSNRLDLATDASAANFERLFTGAGAADAARYADLAYLNYLDYIDADDAPQNLGNGCVERVPMINEVVVTNVVIVQPGGNVLCIPQLWFELCYPFVTNVTTDFDLRVEMTTSESPDNDDSALVPSDTTFTIPNAYPIGETRRFLPVRYTLPPQAGNIGPYPGTISYDMEFKIRVIGNSATVDAVPWPATDPGLRVTIRDTAVTSSNGPVNRIVDYVECNDPRFNWQANSINTEYWIGGTFWDFAVSTFGSSAFTIQPTNTMGASNYYAGFRQNIEDYTSAAFFTAAFPDLDFDRDYNMRVANEDMEVVGELGYLAFAPWRTIRLYRHGDVPGAHPDPPARHEVYETFRIGPPDFGRRGLVNLNSQVDAILEAAYRKMPVNEGAAPGDLVTVDALGANAAAQVIKNGGPYTNVAQLGENTNWPTLVGGRGRNENRAESYIRNAAGLFGARNQLYLVVAAARVANASDNDSAISRGAFLVWRDPKTASDGSHPTFIRQFVRFND